ncbi:MAG: Smr/MutS family protein [Deltaproteobacteria bacterium]|nr:Smr/MutS family protein [Deltaproteobacteria bacterium]
MARKRKKKKKVVNKATKKPEVFNPAFNDINVIKKKNNVASKDPEKKGFPEKKRLSDDTKYFLEAMSGVVPLSNSDNILDRPPDINIRPSHPAPDDELETIAHLNDLVSGITDMDITFSDEFIEGSMPGFSRKLMQRLKKGEFPVQDYLDLHGLVKQEAESRIRDFLLQNHRLGLRCVLVVHGRGLNSENHIPVLKKLLPVWLNRGPVKKIVLAFSTARSYDGGTGAIYILLRRRR